MKQWAKAILLMLIHGSDKAAVVIRSKLSAQYADPIRLEQESAKLKAEHEDLKTRLRKAIAQSEENEAIREKHFGPNPERTAFVKKRNAAMVDRYEL